MHFSYKNSLLIIASILLVGGVFLFAEYRNKQSKDLVYTSPEIQALADALTPEIQNQDTDSDGLKDWEEALLGTDLRKSDTDGDGTNDNAEAKQGRNPLVKGPGDKASETSKNGIADQDLTPTDKLARNFFARYMELSQAGLGDDKQSQMELISSVIENGVVLSKPKTYNVTHFSISPADGPDAIKNYGNIVGGIFTKHNNPNFPSEVIVAKDSIEQDDPQILTKIDPIIVAYKNIVTDLLKVPVPQSMARTHLTLVNSMSILLFSAESLRKIDVDALSGVQGTSVWLGGAQNLNASFNAIKDSLKANKVVYGPQEPGIFFQKD